MPSQVSSRNENLSSSGEMGRGLELKKPPNQYQMSRFSKEKPHSQQFGRSSKLKDKAKPENLIPPPRADQHHGFVSYDNRGFVDMTKSSGGELHGRVTKGASQEEELVKYMSKVPGFLQRGEKVQDNVLNFGVLDWGRLEKWTQKQTKDSLSERSYKTSNGSCSTSANHKSNSEALASQRKQPIFSRNDSFYGVDCSPFIEPLGGMTINLPDVESFLYCSSEKKPHTKDKPQPRDGSDLKSMKGKEKYIDHEISHDTGMNSLKPSRHGHRLSNTSKKKIISPDEPEKCAEKFVKLELDTPEQRDSGKQESIFLILPKDFSRPGSSEVPSRASLDGKLAEFNWGSFSDIFSVDEIQSDESLSDVTHSCPLPAYPAETETELDLKLDDLIKAQGVELPVNPPHLPLHSNGNIMRAETSSSTRFKASMDFDQRTPSFSAEMARDSTTSNRFSFSLARMTKSLSFREGSGRFQLGSNYVTSKSGPAEPETSAGFDTPKGNKGNTNVWSRASPLKKLLNPLLKNRAANQMKEHPQDLKIEPPISAQILENEQCEVPTIKALLYLTAKSELPLFKFVVETRNEILASTVKSLSTFGKNDSKWLYTFYSVQQVRKKSGGWKNHKAKTCGFSYNVIGQMKVSDPFVPSWCEQKSEEQYMVKESVLCSVDLNTANSEFMTSRELAAVVVKMPSTTGKNDPSFSDCVPNGGVFKFEDGMLGNTVVILPGGIHSLPNGGEPSPLIKRWRTGGLCDCGGWDVGCKLKILTNKVQDDKKFSNSRAPLTQVRCHLFEQGEAKQRGPLFTLIPFRDGLFSVEYDAEISSLQAFSICVALINSHSSSHAANEVEVKQEFDSAKVSMMLPGEGRERHAPHPPLSPVGRV